MGIIAMLPITQVMEAHEVIVVILHIAPTLTFPLVAQLHHQSQRRHIKIYMVGERNISSGTYGNDVQQITNLLVGKNYMRTEWITYKKGYPVYDTRVMSAVRRFQKDAGLTQNGKISGSLLSSLQSWDKKNTTLLLGIRTLAYNADSPVSGADVAELIELLNKAGFPPNPKKLKYSGGKAVFTKDIETAVRLFQAYKWFDC